MLRLFDYECTECHNQFEELVEQEEAGNVSCPLCHHPAFRILSPPAKHLSWAAWRADQAIKD